MPAEASGLWAGLGSDYGLYGGVSVHGEGFGSEPRFGARDGFAGLRSDLRGLADVREAVAGVTQGTQVKMASAHAPRRLPGLKLHLSGHLR